MRKTMPGVDRIQMQTLRASVAEYGKQLKLHLRNCGQCELAEKEPYVHCREWWRIKTKLYDAERRLIAHKLTGNPDQLELPLESEES